MMTIYIKDLVCYELVERSYNANLFRGFMSKHLNQYYDLNPNYVLVMDNVAFHHQADIIEVTKIFWILYIFLSPY